jgi:hypothetical protein
VGERDEVLVAVQLPDDLVVAGTVEIEEGDFVERPSRGAFVVDRIEMPVDGRAEVEAFVA